MLAALKALFASPRPRFKTVDLEARLASPHGGQGRGEIEYAAYAAGASKLEIELFGLRPEDVVVSIGSSFTQRFTPRGGRVDVHLSSLVGDRFPACAPGDPVEVRQSGRLVLSGAFAHD